MTMKKLLEMRAKREDARLKAMSILDKAEKEERFLTEEEQKEIDKMEMEIRNWDESIKRAEKMMAMETEDVEETVESKPMPEKSERGFKTFGEQLIATYRASMPGGKVDSRLTTRAASGLNETNPSDGGFLVQQDFVSELLKKTYETGILASKVKKIPISTNANGLKINSVDEDSRANGSRFGGVQAYWEGEADQLTGSKPKFRVLELSLKKLTGLCYATDELLQDASALESVIRQAFADEFGFKIDDAIINGTGSGEPLGILKSGSLVTVAKESSQTDKLTVENLIKAWNRLWARSRNNAVWYINQEIEPYLYTLKIGDTPVYVPAGGLSEKPYGTIFGRPVIPLEQCSAAGEVGDIILADLSQYLLADKGGINATSSIHVRFLYDENVFRFIYRVDGQPIWNKPLTPYKGSSSVSPFVTIAKRN
jgi:Predicted phage phi-C31 gp36 major capsid-like protein|nr:MAG TPA: major capsid protein [Caudoviricetes sp.]